MKKLINALFAVAMISATFANVAFAEEEGGEEKTEKKAKKADKEDKASE